MYVSLKNRTKSDCPSSYAVFDQVHYEHLKHTIIVVSPVLATFSTCVLPEGHLTNGLKRFVTAQRWY